MKLQDKVDALPTGPGVYLMKDRNGRVIYVGKAIDLRARVRSYFSGSDSRAFVQLLDKVLADIEVVVVRNEKESLLLENELIKKHLPRYNVQLRDDKNFLCLRVDLTHPFPRIETVRQVASDGARYFGPFTSAASLRETLRIANRTFQLRTCTDAVLASRRRPCLMYQLGRCPAPCVSYIEQAAYRANLDAALLFLDGRDKLLLATMRERMQTAVQGLDFEEAARMRDRITAIERSLERQVVATSDEADIDVFGSAREADRVVIYTLFIRGGRVAGGRATHATSEFPLEELVTAYVNRYYAEQGFIPDVVLLPPPVPEALAGLLGERRGRSVEVRTPQRGHGRQLLELANENASRALSERSSSVEERERVLQSLKERLRLDRLPRRIECIDVSHFGGESVVASQVASEDLELQRQRYRRFRLRGVTRNDDFAAIYEVVQRRLRQGLELGDLPDLLVIDGGKGQLSSALAAAQEAQVTSVAIVGLAKNRPVESMVREESSAAMTGERVFLPRVKDPVVLPPTSRELLALTRLRDEAHRFAIGYQRTLSRRRVRSSALDAIDGIGPARRQQLLRAFGSLSGIRAASQEAVADVVGPRLAARVREALDESSSTSRA